MPKGKKKGKYEHKRTEQVYSSDEDAGIDMTNDNFSETSGQSDLKSNHEEQENEAQEKFEERVMELVEGLNARAAAARASALVALHGALQRRAAGALLAPHRATLADHAARALRRGRDAERRAAAALAPLLALQIGDEGIEEFVNEVRPTLTAAAADKSASLETRAEKMGTELFERESNSHLAYLFFQIFSNLMPNKCCSSLAVLCYLLEEDISEIIEVMRVYETIFSGSYLKGDGTVKVSGAAAEEGLWHAAALDGWALLMTAVPRAHARALLDERPPDLERLADLLAACSLEVRMAAGTALAMVHEHVTEGGAGGPLEDTVALLLPRLEELTRDSHKYRAKRDRKAQRATFREILKYFEDDEVPSLRVRVGAESVACESWGARAAYGALAASLGAGLRALAPVSPPLRAALRLPDALAAHASPALKLNKLQRHLQNAAACKARTVARNKNRDKRSAALAL